MKKFAANIKRVAQEHPLETIIVAVMVVTATAKLIDAAGHAQGSRAYAKMVNAKLGK